MVTPDAYERGYYAKLYAALQRWLADSFPFENPYFSNRDPRSLNPGQGAVNGLSMFCEIRGRRSSATSTITGSTSVVRAVTLSTLSVVSYRSRWRRWYTRCGSE